MTENSQDAIIRAYATLSSLRKNIDKIGAIPEIYVREYHAVLERLEKGMGVKLSEFRIPDSEIEPSLVSINTLTGETRYTSEKYVAKAFMLTKIDAVLGYFEIITSEKPKKIGLSPPQD